MHESSEEGFTDGIGLPMEMKLHKINIQSGDGEVFKVESDVIKKSKTITNMLEDLGIEFDSDNDEVQEMLPLPNINSIILKKVRRYSRFERCCYFKIAQGCRKGV